MAVKAKDLKESYKVRSSTNYSMFRFIDGNRDVRHAAKIKKSIEEVGLLICPILCNEKMEIIDGQGRFTACKELNLPVYYVMQSGIGIEEVRKMNSVASNWNTGNYIHSYAKGEITSEDYIYLESLKEQFPDFGYTFLASMADPSGKKQSLKNIKNGGFECTDKEYEYAMTKLRYISKFVTCVQEIRGNSDYMYRAIAFCHENDQVDNEYLVTKFKSNYKAMPEIASIRGALKSLEDAYNNHQDSKHEPIFIMSDYDRYLMAIKRENLKKGYEKCS